MHIVLVPIVVRIVRFVATIRVVDELAMEEAKVEAGHGFGKVVAEVRAAYKSGRTKTWQWRVQQLAGVVHMLAEREAEIVEALFTDIGKPAHEAYVSEVVATSTLMYRSS